MTSPNPNSNPRKLHSFVSALIVLFMGSSLVMAQEVTGDVQELSPFVVEETDSLGYLARSSLSGTRLKVPLEDIASQVSVFTRELMDDLSIMNPEEIYMYSTNVDSYLEWSPGGDVGANRGVWQLDNTNVSRGLGPVTPTVNFFPTSFAADSYNTSSLTLASGPNSILFGLGSASGISETSTNKAGFYDRIRFNARVDNWDGWRTSLDVNKELIENRLAIKVAGLKNNNHTFRPESPDENERLYGAITIKPFNKTTIRWNGEDISRRASRAAMILPFDWISPWWDAGQQGFDNSGFTQKTPAGTVNRAIGSQGLSEQVFRNGKLLLYSYGNTANGNSFMDWTNTVETNSAARQSSVLPDQTPDWSLNRPDILDPNVNLYGSAFEVYQRGSINQVFLEQRVLDNLSFEIAASDENFKEDYGSFVLTRALQVKADPNMYLPDGVTPNPNYGKRFINSDIVGNRKQTESTNYRFTGAYEPDFTSNDNWTKWLGRYQVAGLYEIWKYTDRAQTVRLSTLDDASFLTGGNVNNALSGERVPRVRYYLGDNQNGLITPPFADSPLELNEPVVFTMPDGEEVSYYMWDHDGGWGAPSGNTQEVTSKAVNGQGYLLNEKLILYAGWREDDIKRKDSFDADSIARQDFVRENGTVISGRGLPKRLENATFPSDYNQFDNGETTTFGGIVRPLDWLQFHYSNSENFAIQTATWFSPYGDVIPGPYGDGEDYGFSVRFGEGKYMLRANFYENTQFNLRPDNIVSALRTVPFQIEDRILDLDPSYPKLGMDRERYGNANYQATRTVEATGMDIEFIANPTDNMRIFFNIGRQQTENQLDPVWWSWVEERLPAWQSFGNGWEVETLTDNNPITFKEAYEDWAVTQRDPLLAVDGQYSDNQREWRANLMATYVFKEGLFNGFTFGLGGRYRSAPYVGYPLTTLGNGQEVLDIRNPYKGENEIYIDTFVKYKLRSLPLSVFSERSNASIQVNIRNLFDSDDYLVSQVKTDGSAKSYRYQSPRQIAVSFQIDM